MQLTAQTDIGLRVLLSLAWLPDRRVSTAWLAERHRLSFSHVQKVVQSLQSAHFVRTVRGRLGGIELARPAHEITVGEVVRALEPNTQLVECLRPGPHTCRLAGGCGLARVLARGRLAMFTELDGHSIGELAAQTPALGLLAEQPGS